MMRRAFVLQLGPETKTAEGPFEGFVEEVDSCTEHYRGAVEVSGGERFDVAMASVNKAVADKRTAQSQPRKKSSRS